MDLLATLSADLSGGALPDVLIADRYKVEGLVGTGGFGAVYLALDRRTDERVAIKVLEGIAGDRFRRETAALRLLQVPGVVRLRDEFDDDGRTCLVMDYVPGSPFPGCPIGSWGDLEHRALALLEILGRIHAFGVVHRDLKPANVLVRPDGRPVVLDFGLSSGPALGRTITQTGQILGTPAYFAPEQLFGQRADARADLYAIGVMLYEALASELPHADGGAQAILMRGTRAPPPVRDKAPHVPEHVAAAIDSLLAVHPDDRPQSASEVISLLSGRGSSISRVESAFAWVGPRDAVDAIVERAARGLSTRVGGEPGSGRSRTAHEAGAVLEGQGRSLAVLGSGGRPLASLGPLLSVEPSSDLSWAEARSAAHRTLTGWLRDGGVLIVDSGRPVDRWSRALLDEVGDLGVVIEVVDGPCDVEAKPLESAALSSLFWGPEMLFHLPSDAAAELHRRTDGFPGRVRAEVMSWVRSGLARWDDGRLRIGREALVRLGAGFAAGHDLGARGAAVPEALAELVAWIELAWPHGTAAVLAAVVDLPTWELEATLDELVADRLVRIRGDGVYETGGTALLGRWTGERRAKAHGRLADVLSHDLSARLFHLAASGRVEELAAAAAQFAREMADRGRLAEAEAVLSVALAGVRASDEVHGAEQLVIERVETALHGASPAALRRALLDLDRTGLPPLPILPRLRRLLEASSYSLAEESARILEATDEIGPFSEARLERRRRALRARATTYDDEARERELSAIETWARGAGDEETLASVSGWRALALFRELRFREAASMHLAAVGRSKRRIFKLGANLNAASALLEAGDYSRARSLAVEAREEAASLRHSMYEGRAAWLVRAAEYRNGDVPQLAPELIEAFVELGNPIQLGLILVTESAIAWRLGETTLLAQRAGQCAVAWTRCAQSDAALWARALSWLGDAEPEPEGLEKAQSAATHASLPALAVQISALLALGHFPVPDEAMDRARTELAAIPTEHLHHNQGVLTWREMGDALGIELPAS